MKSWMREYYPAIVSGALLSLSFPRLHWYPLAWCALIPLLWRTRSANPAACLRHFFLAGWVFYLLLLQWLLTNCYWAGGWAIWGYLLLTLCMAGYWGVVGVVWAWLRSRIPGALAAPFSLALLWATMEFLQDRLFTGFGWGALAYAQGRDLPLIQWASVVGAPLVSALVVAFNACVAEMVARPARRILGVAAAIVLVGLSHGLGYLMLEAPDYGPKPFKVGIVQANFPLEMKWDNEYTEEMVRNAAEKSLWLAQRERLDLVVWPESLVMDSLSRPGLRDRVTSLPRSAGCPLFTGAMRLDENTGRWRNSSFLVNARGEVASYYDKLHLAPFGEYVPLGDYLPLIQKLVPIIGDVEPGSKPQVFSVSGRRVGALICFEVLFTGMAERLRSEGADVLVVITNLGWFGRSCALPQELEIARMRAVESRLPLVHCANTGVSGVFDPWGRFTPLRGYFDDLGRYREFVAVPKLEHLTMERLVDAVAVSAPGKRLLPAGPQVFPWVALGMSCVLIVWAFLVGKPVRDR